MNKIIFLMLFMFSFSASAMDFRMKITSPSGEIKEYDLAQSPKIKLDSTWSCSASPLPNPTSVITVQIICGSKHNNFVVFSPVCANFILDQSTEKLVLNSLQQTYMLSATVPNEFWLIHVTCNSK